MRKTAFAVAGLASLALLGAAHAADDKSAKRDDPPGFNQLDKDNDGQLTKSEAAGNPNLAKRFAEVDSDGDGKVSRGEYLTTMAAKDLRGVRESLADAVEPGRQGPKEKPEERGFNELDRNGDGKVSRAEAGRNPKVLEKFARTDGDNDGFLTRTEYLQTAAAEDWRDFRDWAADAIRPDDKASAGGSSK